MKAKHSTCPVESTLTMIGGRWKIPLVFHPLVGAKGFSELFRVLPGITQKVLTQQLREMERRGLVEGKVFAQVPPKVIYSLNPRGWRLKPVVDAMCPWGELRGAPAAALEAQS